MQQEVSAVLALALGLPVEGRRFSWPSAFELAHRERCAALAWSRSHAAIRQLAPPEVAARWRAEALSVVSLAEYWQSLLLAAVDALGVAGVDVVVLKGLPLAALLYDEAHVRPTADLDLYIPVVQRVVADAVLHQLGWLRRRGEPPHESVYRIEHGGRVALLEVHSALLDDELVAHLPFAAPGSRRVRIGERLIPAHDDAQLPSFLATHLAKHALPPLLWFIDFTTLWSRLGDEGQRTAWHAARAARAHRYLEWAITRAFDIRAGATGDRKALRRVGFWGSGRSERHNALRVATLAANARDAAQVLRAWLIPGWVRNAREAGGLLGKRFVRLLSRGLTLRRAAAGGELRAVAGEAARRKLTLGPADLDAILQLLAERDAEFLLCAGGGSMSPSIEAGMTVSLVPRGVRPVRVGEVVLVKAGTSRWVLHRVVGVRGGEVETRGDANPTSDTPVPLESVLAIATGIVSAGARRAIPTSRWIRSFRRARAILRQAAAGRRRHSSKSIRGGGSRVD